MEGSLAGISNQSVHAVLEPTPAFNLKPILADLVVPFYGLVQ
jgi:hypothetical protein